MYKLFNSEFTNQPAMVLHIPSNTFIPFAADNTDYQEYLAWLAEGNTPEPADEVGA
jgi:hypothetical protein